MYDILGYSLGSLRTIFGLFILFLLILATFRKPLIGVIVFIFLQVAQPYFVNFNPYLFTEFHLPRLIAIVTLVSFIITVLITKAREYKLYAPPQNWLMFLMLIMMFISCRVNYLSISQNQPVNDFFKMVVLYFMITSIITKKSDVNICGWAIIISGLIITFKAYNNYRTEGLNVPYWGMNYNGFGYALVMLIPLLVIYFVRTKKILLKLFLGGSLAVTILCLIRTGSRSSFLAFLVVSVLLFIHLAITRGYKRYILFIFPMAIALILFRTPETLWERYETIKTYEESRSAMGRVYAWKAGFRMMKEHPFVGVGPGNFVNVFPQYADRDALIEKRVRWNISPHNTTIAIGAQFGLVALFFWILMLFLVFRDSVRIIRHFKGDKQNRNFIDTEIALMISCVGWTVCGVFGTALYSADPHIYVALIIASRKFLINKNG